jgi:hypothetical protein
MGVEIVAAIIAGIAALTAAGISAASTASSTEALASGQREASSLSQKQIAQQQRQQQSQYGLQSQQLELGKIRERETSRQNQLTENRLLREEKKSNMSTLYAKMNSFLNDARERDNRLLSIWR